MRPLRIGMTMADTFTKVARAIFAKKVLAHVATFFWLTAHPRLTPVWATLDGNDIVINMHLG